MTTMIISTSATTEIVPEGGRADVIYVTTEASGESYVVRPHEATSQAERVIDWEREAALFGAESLEWADLATETVAATWPID